MSHKVRVFVGDEEVSVAALCEALGVNHSRLSNVASKIAGWPDTPVRAFYEAWRDDALPVPLRPCESRQLYRLYSLWCSANGITPVTETKLLRELPDWAPKTRKQIRINGVMFTRTVVVPDSYQPPEAEPASEHLGRECALFADDVDCMEWGQKG